jgi:hypothetical protein
LHMNLRGFAVGNRVAKNGITCDGHRGDSKGRNEVL